MKILLIIISMFVTINVNALDKITSIDEPWTQEATVGEIDESLKTYEILITWDELIFDYVYDETTESYGWEYHGVNDAATLAISNIRHDKYPVIPTIVWTSEEKYDFVKAILKEETYVCIETEFNQAKFDLGEQLTGAQCNANPKYSLNDPNHSYDESKYYKVGYGFKNLVNNHPQGDYTDDIPNLCSYVLFITLENDTNKETTTPVVGDKIGTLTVSFEAAENNQ